VLATLRDEFVNCWLLAKDLEKLAAASDDPDLKELCALVRENYGYPVDSVLVGPDLAVLGHVNVNAPEAMDPASYLAFLRRGLAAARGEPPPPAVASVHDPEPQPVLRLTPQEPRATLLDVIRRRGLGQPSIRFFTLDASAFTGAGKLEVTVSVGTAEASGRFELCAAPPGNPETVVPVETLESVAPGASGTMTFDFERGAQFMLTAMPGPKAAEGDVNAFQVCVTVRNR
jgi:hypothetical protein